MQANAAAQMLSSPLSATTAGGGRAPSSLGMMGARGLGLGLGGIGVQAVHTPPQPSATTSTTAYEYSPHTLHQPHNNHRHHSGGPPQQQQPLHHHQQQQPQFAYGAAPQSHPGYYSR